MFNALALINSPKVDKSAILAIAMHRAETGRKRAGRRWPRA
jgi:hypothetical protein